MIALVITIIVLLILAGVTIATLTGDNGLLTKTGNVKNAASDAEIEEQIKLAYQEYQIGRFINSETTLENSMKTSLEKIYNDTINIQQQGNNVKVVFTNAKKTYKYYSNGEVKVLLEPTNIYARLDDNNILYLRSKQEDGYNVYINSGSIQPNWNIAGNANRENIKKVIIEEPIAPSNTRRNVYLLQGIRIYRKY